MKKPAFKTVPKVLLITGLFALGGCGSLDEFKPSEPTLADLETVAAPVQDPVLPAVSRQKVIDSYRALLAILDDPALSVAARNRLGSLMMLESEQLQVDASEEELRNAKQFYGDVIAYHKKMLNDYPDREENVEIYYQLSKAYDLDGKLEQSIDTLGRLVRKYPDSIYAAESHFRRGEYFFANADYKQAQYEYGKTLSIQNQSSFHDNALYMKGWTQFKRSRYEDSLRSFVQVMDRAFPSGIERDVLQNSQRELVDDTMRVMGLAFTYLEGAQSIQALVSDVGRLHYEPTLYAQLADLYLEKKRYKDSADTYQAYIEEFPQSEEAPIFHVKQIEAFIAGDFPTLVLPAKQAYVEGYGVSSSYWTESSQDTRAALKPNLRLYLNELAATAHADAQAMKAEWDAKKNNKRAVAKLKFRERDVVAEYRTAGRWYSEYIATFPDDESVDKIWFLLAESQYDAGDYKEAIETYEQIAYQLPNHPKAAESAYAAVLAYDDYIATLALDDSESRQLWARKRIDSSVSFAETFDDDKRAVPVLSKAAQDLLSSGEQERAIQYAQRIIDWPAPVDRKLQESAWLVVARGQFERQDYAAAEQAYSQLKNVLADGDPRLKDVNESLAASIYKQGEALVEQGKLSLAVDRLLQVAVHAPGSSIEANAEFDAATHLLTLKSFKEAIEVMERLRQRYPSNELAAQLPEKLIYAYQESEQWQKAANELESFSQGARTPEEKREAIYLSAELYQKSGDKAAAVRMYQQYSNRFPEPFGARLEANINLSELHKELEQEEQYRNTLRTLISLHDNAGDQQTDRSRFIAAQSSMFFADLARESFNASKLTLPLKKSLKRKKQALQSALDQYTRTAGYEVQEFATKSTYSIAEIYAQLSQDLMGSERPGKMNELELEQYEVLLEEQAYPFEEQAIEIHETNTQRSWVGIYDTWVKASFESLSRLMPGRYNKQEAVQEYSNDVR